MNGLRSRKRMAAAAALGILAVALAVATAIQQVRASQLTRETDHLRRLLAKARLELRDRAKWNRDYCALSSALGGRFRECSWSEQMPFMVSQLTGIAKRRGITIETLQPQPMSKKRCVVRFPLRIALQSDLKELTAILEEIERTTPLLKIERTGIKRAEAGKLQVDMTISSFAVLDPRAPVPKRRALSAGARPPYGAEDRPAEPTRASSGGAR